MTDETAPEEASCQNDHLTDKTVSEKPSCQNGSLTDKTARELGERFKASPRTIYRDAKFTQAVDALSSIGGEDVKSILRTVLGTIEYLKPMLAKVWTIFSKFKLSLKFEKKIKNVKTCTVKLPEALKNCPKYCLG